MTYTAVTFADYVRTLSISGLGSIEKQDDLEKILEEAIVN